MNQRLRREFIPHKGIRNDPELSLLESQLRYLSVCQSVRVEFHRSLSDSCHHPTHETPFLVSISWSPLADIESLSHTHGVLLIWTQPENYDAAVRRSILRSFSLFDLDGSATNNPSTFRSLSRN